MTEKERIEINVDIENIKYFLNAPAFHSKQQLRQSAERLIQICEELLNEKLEQRPC